MAIVWVSVLQGNKKKYSTLVDTRGFPEALVDLLRLNFHDLRLTLNTQTQMLISGDWTIDKNLIWLRWWHVKTMQTTNILPDCRYLTYSTDSSQMHFESTVTHFWQPHKHCAMAGQKYLNSIGLLLYLILCFWKQGKLYFCSTHCSLKSPLMVLDLLW